MGVGLNQFNDPEPPLQPPDGGAQSRELKPPLQCHEIGWENNASSRLYDCDKGKLDDEVFQKRHHQAQRNGLGATFLI